jgi:pilus assembly protein Flp/PilA
MRKVLAAARAKLYSAVTRPLVKKEEGASLVEYGLLIGLIALVCLGAIQLLGNSLNGLFGTVATAVNNANTAGS